MHANVQTMTISDRHLTHEEKARDRHALLNTDHIATLWLKYVDFQTLTVL